MIVRVPDGARGPAHCGLPVNEFNNSSHLPGTCRTGDGPAKSVVGRYHGSYDIPNLFFRVGSSLVTSGRGQPTMTIQVLAFRCPAMRRSHETRQ